MTKSAYKFVIVLVALLMCATVVFAACNNNQFKPVEKPSQATVDAKDNGGAAVEYGEWLYYVNGYQSSASADNTYTNDVVDAPRIGSVVRIKLDELEKIFELNDKDYADDEDFDNAAEAIADYVRKNAQTVIPKIYYSANSTSTQFTGIFIFNNRIYVTTPNDALTANGDPLTDQLVLMSFDLGGGDARSHFTFTSNDAQIWLAEVNGKVIATYLMNDILHTLDVESGKDEVVCLANDELPDIDNKVSSVNWDVTSNSVFFIDKFGSLCKLTVGKVNYDVICANDSYKNHDDHIEAGSLTYTIKSVNKGIVYYTVKDSDDNTVVGDTILYWAENAENKDNVALASNNVSAYGWDKDKVIITKSKKSGEKTYYSICKVETVIAEDGSKTYVETALLAYGENDTSITINRIENDTLYYTANSIAYTLDLSATDEGLASGTPYAYSLASATGWAVPDFVEYNGVSYVITLASGSVSIVKFDPVEKTNSDSLNITLTAVPSDDK